MEQETERIERQIEARREQLGRNLDELETRVKSAFDWRTQFQKNPWVVMGVAFGGGLALSSIAGRSGGGRTSGSSYSTGSYSSSSASSAGTRRGYSSPSVSRLASTWTHIQDALLAAATTKAEQFLDELVPGFRNHYRTGTGGGSAQGRYEGGQAQSHNRTQTDQSDQQHSENEPSGSRV